MAYKYLHNITKDYLVKFLREKNALIGIRERLEQGLKITAKAAQELDEWLDKNLPDDAKVNWQAKSDEYNRQVEADVKRQGEAIRGKQAAIARLNQWEQEGVFNTEKNHKAINSFLQNAPELKEWRDGGGVLSPEIIDTTIKWLKHRNELDFAPPKPVAPAPAAPVETPEAEVLGTLSDGTKQLPLSTQASHSHSVAQLKDLTRRQLQKNGLQSPRVKKSWFRA